MCKGKPPTGNSGGRAAQLRYLRANKHPRTRKQLPPPVDDHGKAVGGKHIYSNLVHYRQERTDIGNVERGQAVSGANMVVQAASSSTGGKSVAQKFQEMRERIRVREKEAKAAAKAALSPLERPRGKQRPGTEWLQLDGTEGLV